MTARVETGSLFISARIVAEVTELLTSPAELILALAENSEAFVSLTRAVNLLRPTVPSLTLQNLLKAVVRLEKRLDAIESEQAP